MRPACLVNLDTADLKKGVKERITVKLVLNESCKATKTCPKRHPRKSKKYETKKDVDLDVPVPIGRINIRC